MLLDTKFKISWYIRYQKSFESGQPIRVELKFSENNPGGIYGYALVLTNR